MTFSAPRLRLAMTAAISVAAYLTGCAAGDDPDFDESSGSASGGNTAATGGAGGMGAEGGAGQGGESLCATDCSAIDTPPCQVAVCNDGSHQGTVGSCVVVPDDDGVACDDGQFCTVGDSCQAGQCAGGDQNDCGMSPSACNEVVCEEASQSCSEQAAENGASCETADLCVVGSTCSNGLCTGGSANDCFFAPVPDDCHVAVCNPNNGACEPVPGNDGEACTLTSDLCSVGNTCSAGVCSGGSPKDCSNLTQGCFDGVCDQATGQCTQMPIMAGGQCAEATDQCNVGICDLNGSCNPMPDNEGQACDTDGCFVGQLCGSGTCQGGSEITSCINNDDCCPASCDLTNDDDCGCDFALISNETQLTDATVTGLITANGHTFVNYDNNNNGQHTENLALLDMYETIILHEHDRVISTLEMNNLITWVNNGGSLLVTGYDSLGSPTDSNMASVVNCTGPGDGPFSSALTVVDATHPIMQGPAQAFTLNMGLTASSTDHDQCTPGSGATKLIDVSGSSKLVVTDNMGQGKVIYWNGNGGSSGPPTDWTGSSGSQPDLQNLFVNVLDHMCQ